ncbi:MAG: hypothetical protein KZQ64_12320 [gamma proteobacterium symbiont of Bathyaustriella thionipta]|nr:hypothetical protein [gamma proteobacterium symbiont of Bathyaustriella thionipta]MCU7949522.1 hypothetical protein [gamma proteobacterium symbiont of Bathyaustriella thionipta]MCU7954157.1 hypothetical protein [gamma proteobacterium symbiont of Bathyaustriella thionipta]MCU7956108.1 hypothetical protein [gamma proteobacterium symbiont of Bathyaustriella thionipta]MCU7967570.1 hypothetical protein [gamma proteobacterium symbiont of Bathyaustriella thionipta]
MTSSDVEPGAGVTTFRDRDGKTLGDILNSAPQFVGGTLNSNGNPLAYINTDFSESSSYELFQKTNKNRQHMIYVGANDGMLHGLTVDSNPATSLATTSSSTLAYLEDFGKEAFAYFPSAVIKRLNKLTSSEYDNKGIASHRYLVDGSPTVEDAYDGSHWKTMLVSGLGAGGQGVFALDVTDGAATSGNNVVLWEFNDSDDADLGYTYSRPVIARLQDGNWYAIFGNGYNNTETRNMDSLPDTSVSTTGHAVLYLLKMSGPTGHNNRWVLGTDYYKLDTGRGDTTTPNGLATVSTLDLDRDQVVDAIYAGDLQGNLWRFDLLDGDTNINSGLFPSLVENGATKPSKTFRIAYGNNAPEPVFSTGLNQPITSAPVIGSHPIDGFMVIFGTGQYIEPGDNQTTGLATQSLYGIWDSCVMNGKVGNSNKYQINYKGSLIPSLPGSCLSVSKLSLLQQEIVKESIEVFTEAVDSNGDGVIDSSDTPTANNTEEVRITTGYKLYPYDQDKTPVNTQIIDKRVDQYNNTVSYYTYESETGWLNSVKNAIAHKGWYLNMVINGNNKSERNINKPLLLGGTVFFNTYMPSNASVCGAAGDTWVYSLNASDGRQLSSSVFDLNQDGQIDLQDEFNQSEVIGARKKTGYTPGGTLINAGRDKHSITFGGDINNDIDDAYFKIKEGRQTWRVIR